MNATLCTIQRSDPTLPLIFQEELLNPQLPGHFGAELSGRLNGRC